jgi:hypothetical protein
MDMHMQVRHLASMSPDRAAAALMSLQDDEEAAAKLVVGGASGVIRCPLSPATKQGTLLDDDDDDDDDDGDGIRLNPAPAALTILPHCTALCDDTASMLVYLHDL